MRGFAPAILLLAAMAPAAALGVETGAVHTTAGAGLSMTISTRWVDGPGYRPVAITVTPTAPVAADRTLTVEVLLFEGGPEHSLRVAQDVPIPAGSGPVSAVLAVPHAHDWSGYAVNVVEDGAMVRGLSVPRVGRAFFGRGSAGEMLPRILFVSGARPGPMMPDTSQLAAWLPVGDYQQSQPFMMAGPGTTGPGPGILTTPPAMPPPAGPALPTAAVRAPSQLPVRWIEYTTFDVVCATLAELEDLARKQPDAFRALIEWTAAGGNLWVCGAGKDFERLGAVEKLLGLAPGEKDVPAGPGVPPARAWREPARHLFGQPMQGMPGGPQTYYGPRYGPMMMPPEPSGLVLPAPQIPPPSPAAPEKPFFRLRDVQAGMAVAFAEEYPFPGTAPGWAWVFNAMGTERWQWSERHGLSLVRENREFWNFLIPGVGLVPAIEFGVLITVFVVAIGPLNYVLLKRRKRLHLLVVTIPASAAAVTLALFVYALLADGLGTRVRARSVTHLDQRNGRAACWARLSYYAGIAPSGGLTFPADTAFYPLAAYPWETFSGGAARGRELIWGKDGQWLPSGWLAARTPSQMVTVRSRPTGAGLDIEPAEGGAPQLAVVNRLGTGVKSLLVRAADGAYYALEDLADGAQGAASRADLAAVAPALNALYTANMPQYPEGMDTRYYDLGRPRRYWYRGYGYYEPGLSPPNPQTARLERLLQAHATASGLQYGAGLPKRSYVAIVPQAPEVVLGTPAAREESSFHVVLGEF